MKFKKILLCISLFLILVISVGCLKSKEVSQEADLANMQNNINLQILEEKPVFIGKVKEIIGNEVTVYKIQMTQDNNQSADNVDQGKEKVMRMPRFTVTEETETFIIPVGTPIILKQRGSSEIITAELTEIKKDQMLSVWKDGDTVKLVQLMGGSGGRLGNGNGGGQRPQGGIPGGMGGRPQ
ncbi:MAG: hypothetical protein PWQ67_1308 [Clostridia bacterium]|jgi:hypothetical protein|nr:hypothetical protein [Clostridia bacterium]MDN5322854.1 hypothetical protein [Clostridia bacterium]